MNYTLKAATMGLAMALNALGAKWTPTQSDLDAAVTEAKADWGRDTAVRVVMEPADRCGLVPDAKHPNANSADINTTAAITSFAGTQMVYDDGTRGPVTGSWVIHLNAACDWSDREWRRRMIEHEYGHALGILRHSTDPHSIMFWVVYQAAAEKKYGHQEITIEDRARISTVSASK